MSPSKEAIRAMARIAREKAGTPEGEVAKRRLAQLSTSRRARQAAEREAARKELREWDWWIQRFAVDHEVDDER